jgi:hypothetical protein
MYVLTLTRTRDKLHGRNIELPSPPICEAKPEVKINVHGDEMVDNYSWLKDRENPDGIADVTFAMTPCVLVTMPAFCYSHSSSIDAIHRYLFSPSPLRAPSPFFF